MNQTSRTRVGKTPTFFCLLAIAFTWCPGTRASDNDSYEFPSTEFLSSLGLEEIPGYSIPYNERNEVENSKFLRLGSVKSGPNQCVTLLKLLDRKKACNKVRCKGMFGWGRKGQPLNGQFVLLSQPCNKSTFKNSTLLFPNHEMKDWPPTKNGVDANLTTHVIGLSPDRYLSEKAQITWRPIEAGGWAQIIEKGQYKIEFQTEASEGILSWRPKKGFGWDETEP